MKPKLTQEMLETMVQLKGDGLSDKDICAAVGIHHSSFYRWINEPKTKLQRALSEEIKKADSQYKRTLLTTIRKAALEKTGHWTAAAWLLERKFPEEYSQNRIAEKEQSQAPRIVLGVNVACCRGDEAADEGGCADD